MWLRIHPNLLTLILGRMMKVNAEAVLEDLDQPGVDDEPAAVSNFEWHPKLQF